MMAARSCAQMLLLTPRLRTSARKLTRNLANSAAMFDAVGDVTFTCLVGVKVELAPRNQERRPLGAASILFGVSVGAAFRCRQSDVRLASESGTTADL